MRILSQLKRQPENLAQRRTGGMRKRVQVDSRPGLCKWKALEFQIKLYTQRQRCEARER